MTTAIKFDIPNECRTFDIFRLLPPEIRQRIWELYLFTPGVHFLKLQSPDGSWIWTERRHLNVILVGANDSINASDDLEDRLLHDLRNDEQPRESYPACLAPVGPCPRADVSHYKALRRQLSILSQTCVEARDLVKRLYNRPDTLKLGDGKVVCLGKSSDVVYLDYFPPSLYQNDGNLNTEPDCPALSSIKRIAVRFSHTWRPVGNSCRCGLCRQGIQHGGSYPAHLYQFLARHLPNLEEFFFIDYFIVHKSKSTIAHDERPNMIFPKLGKARFQAGNRLYHEANDKEWVMSPEVSELTRWLRSSFVRYATESSLCHHKNPESVRFSILACEWNISPPVQRQAIPLKSDVKDRATSAPIPEQIRGPHMIPKQYKSNWLYKPEATQNHWLDPEPRDKFKPVISSHFTFEAIPAAAQASQKYVTATGA